ncbi:hypothetical protein SAMN05443633_105157 [Chryseobacterium arachidis]|uniref:WG containing repeat-containing protein n=3 Tax=Chryseobacterium arachidis TaxID=1416778 RepID=A0A1M5D524_9FLAO|nr:hypothetical protein SAMN05443633_105157 [Chryseobacterium arachidis]
MVYLNSFVISKHVFYTMKSQVKTLSTFLIVLFFSGTLFSQDQLSKFKDKIDFYVLDNFVSRIDNDSVFVSNSYQYGANNYDKDGDFYFCDNKTKNRIFPYGFEIAYPFVGKTAVVKYKGRWGLIDRNGRFIFYSVTTYPIRLTSYEKYAVFDNSIMYDLRSGILQEHSIYCAEPAGPNYFISKSKSGKYNLIEVEKGPVFKTEMDSIIPNQNLIYKGNSNRSLLILKKNNKYGLYLSNGTEILKIKYEKAKFLGNYFMLYENNKWNYYTYENNKLNLILSSPFECITPAYQTKVIGTFKKDNQYNLLKIDGEILPENFDFISDNAAYGVKDNTMVIFNSDANYYTYTEK